ncbi:SURF1 family protein [Amnibacterium flavum]|uniref:SURF1-like protein n=1 Tax=Amnibacterium flavum TaxID=2173173 RepID=A0A2V1HW32_9MICO|nr:SURF1 family protein [Amnibacterium flavum]PVZ94424.1 SURF1 family protein [Amnibacterium flavum]
MRNWRFVLSKRWFGYLAFAVAFAIACVFLSNWQLSRRAEKVAEIDRVTGNYDATPVPLDDLIPTLTSYSEDDEWHPVTMTGVYEDELLVRNRPLNGKAGFEVLAPLRLDDGSVFVVDRGWVPAGNTTEDEMDVPTAPTGEVTVVARLKAAEPALPGGTSDEGVLASIQPTEVAKIVGGDVYSATYGLVVSESPAVAEMPVASVKPEPDEGPHLSYAFQWLVFAIIGFAGLGVAIRQEYRYRNAEDPAEQERAARRERKRAAKRTDSDEEDELIDAGAVRRG